VPKQGLDASPLCHSYVTVEEKFRHYSASMRDAKIELSRVKTVVSINRRYFAPEFVMRRSGVRFISPAPSQIRKPCYVLHSGVFLLPNDVRADVSQFLRCLLAGGQQKPTTLDQQIVLESKSSMSSCRAAVACSPSRL
jgi:hypothetical protein